MSDLLTRVYALMEEEGIKPTQLAKKLGMSSSSFPDWAKGKGSPSLKAVIQFSEYFNVPIDYLVYGIVDSEIKQESESKPLEFSSPEDKELLEKFHLLTPELKQKAISYIEGMAAAMPKKSLDAAEKLYG